MELIDLVAVRTRELRVNFNLSQQELAELSELSELSIQRIEARKKKQIWLRTVEQLAAAFSLQVYEFLGPKMPSQARLSRKVASSRVHRK
jgi:transcriptional regulator with XRE-family HTH domain